MIKFRHFDLNFGGNIELSTPKKGNVWGDKIPLYPLLICGHVFLLESSIEQENIFSSKHKNCENAKVIS